MHPFEAFVYERLSAELRTWPLPQSGIDVTEVYLLSMCLDDSHEAPCPYHVGLYFSYNTESHWQAVMDGASSPGEARWTRPFWPDDDRVVIPGHATLDSVIPPQEAMTVMLRNAWLVDLGLGANVVLDEHGAAGIAEDGKGADLDREWREFAALCARVGRRLHEEGVIVAVFGRPIPVRVTDIEGTNIDQLTLDANPPGVADEFYAWCVSDLEVGIEQALSMGWSLEEVWRWIAELCRDNAIVCLELRKLDDPGRVCTARQVGLWDRTHWESLRRRAPWDATAWVDLAKNPSLGCSQ